MFKQELVLFLLGFFLTHRLILLSKLRKARDLFAKRLELALVAAMSDLPNGKSDNLFSVVRWEKLPVDAPRGSVHAVLQVSEVSVKIYAHARSRRTLRIRHEISVSNISCIWTNCIVPFSVERVGTNIYFFNLFVCYLGSWRVGVGVEFGPHL